MPTLPGLVALIPYFAVKTAGYASSAVFINRSYGSSVCASPLGFGVTRTAVGAVLGVLFLAFLASAHLNINPYLAVAPLRFAIWLGFLRIYFGNAPSPGRWLLFGALGSVWSYLLDLVVAGIVLLMPGALVPWC